MNVNFPPISKLVNERFVPLWNNQDRYIILWGGRGSSKSVFAAKKLIYRCLKEKYFRYILVRNVYEDIKDSSYQTIKDCVEEMGLSSLFKFTTSPLQITCVNGNKFIARGCDKTTKLKSIKDPTGVWYEEDIPSESDFITITSGIRSMKAGYLQEIFTINPEVEGDYEEHWFFKQFFKDKYPEVNFRSTTRIEIPGDEPMELSYTSHHSTYKDNRFIGREFMAFLESLKKTNEYYFTIYCLGHWGNRQSGGQFYKCFSRAKHIGSIKDLYPDMDHGGRPYNPELPLHMAWDFNVNPYVTCCIWQINGKVSMKIAEILLQHPRNTNMAVCAEFEKKFPGHTAGLFIYGDPGGLKQSTADETTVRVKEKDYSEFTKIESRLSAYRPQRRVPRVYPPVKLRGDFISEIMEFNYAGITFVIDEGCKKSVAEYSYLKEASDGTKHKEMYKDEVTEVQCQKYGHISDADDYFLTSAFTSEFSNYQRGGKTPKIKLGKNVSKNAY
ncbi:Bacteriophage terminase, large subunit [uncultured Caudovirales phage]|uniref:Bacteriophage terminase, large subunit n=1 Tax=uncultured Caudovirales phage TaxID=2100421 RepID=A0A6J5SVX6_9CAUD|nr:Bacteriophage terminase, large subunit [uncultured Caudovirales phage]